MKTNYYYYYYFYYSRGSGLIVTCFERHFGHIEKGFIFNLVP